MGLFIGFAMGAYLMSIICLLFVIGARNSVLEDIRAKKSIEIINFDKKTFTSWERRSYFFSAVTLIILLFLKYFQLNK